MKVLKILGFVLVGLIVLIIVAGIFAPKKYQVERTVTIDAPVHLVFPHVKYWRNWEAWSPWAKADPQIVVTVEGTDGEVGSMYKYEGDPDITGRGEMTNTGITENKEILYHLHFLEPWESESDGYIRLNSADDQTAVSWGFLGETPFPFNVLMLFMSMDAMVGPDFEEGLALLKDLCEKKSAMVKKYNVERAEFPATIYLALRNTVSMSELQQFYATNFMKIEQERQKHGLRNTGMPCGLYYMWDQSSGKTDLAAAIPVHKAIQSSEVETIRFPKTSALKLDYFGDYSDLPLAHEAMNLYLQQNALVQKFPIVEEYVTDPMAEPDTSKWLTRIYYFTE